MELHSLVRAAAFAVSAAFSSSIALAHDPGLSSARIDVGTDSIRIELCLDVRDLGADAGRLDDSNSFADFCKQLEPQLVAWLGHVDGKPSYRLVEADDLRVDLEIGVERGVGSWSYEFDGFVDLPRGHRHFVSTYGPGGRLVKNSLLSSARPFVVVDIADARSSQASSGMLELAFEFGWLGIEHIWIGYDHILFLLGLLVAAFTLRSAIRLITAFTIAHSITLLCASLDLIYLPSIMVEVVIALSVVFVAIENLLVASPRHRWKVTFAFGLVHGFGFASVLRDLYATLPASAGLPGAQSMVSLLSFNVGVELGQLAIAAVAIPVFARIRRAPWSRPWFGRVMNAVLILAGSFWLIERLAGI